MVRIVVPQVKLWYFLIPGFLFILLSFRSDPVFVGIAYDAGGVASGSYDATFGLRLPKEPLQLSKQRMSWWMDSVLLQW